MLSKKNLSLIAISIVLIIAAIWITHDPDRSHPSGGEQSESKLAGVPTEPPRSDRNPPPDRLAVIDWHEVAKELMGVSKHFDRFKPSPEIEKHLRQLSKSELLSALKAVGTRNHPIQENLRLRRYLITLLVQKDPEDFLLDPDATPLSEQPRLFWEGLAISEWVRISPNEAITWLDSAAKTTRDSTQMARLEHNLFSTLIAVDHEQAKARLLATSEDQRRSMIQNFDGFGTYWSSEDFQNHNIAGRFAEVSRLFEERNSERFITSVISGRGEQDRPAGISRIQDSLKDWKKGRGTWLPATTVADYLEKIDATPREQELCINATVQEFNYYNKDGDLAAFRKQFTAEVQEIRSRN